MGERKNKKMTRDGGWREEDDGEVVVRGGGLSTCCERMIRLSE